MRRSQRQARASLVRLTELTIDAFPATIIPSPLVTELDALAREAGLKLPLVEELAADIFMGSFSAKFVEAAKLAARLLQGSLYERYYAIDYGRILAIDDVQRQHEWAAPTSPTFDAYCVGQAGGSLDGWSVAANGTIIEQSQILTTHNRAALTGPFGVGEALTIDWPRVARKSFEHQLALANRLRNNPRPLRMIKDLAYAWRQTIFFMTRMDSGEVAQFLTWAQEQADDQPAHVAAVMNPVLGGVRDICRRRPVRPRRMHRQRTPPLGLGRGTPLDSRGRRRRSARQLRPETAWRSIPAPGGTDASRSDPRLRVREGRQPSRCSSGAPASAPRALRGATVASPCPAAVITPANMVHTLQQMAGDEAGESTFETLDRRDA